MDSFQSIGLNARCILGEWSLDRNSARVSQSYLRVLWCASYMKVAKLRGAHCKCLGGCVLSTFHPFPTPIDGFHGMTTVTLKAQVIDLSCLKDLTSH